MAALLIVMSVFFCGYGLMLIFAKDLAWSMTVWSNSLYGLVSERTDQWDALATVRGVVLLIMALVVLCALPSVTASSSQSNANGDIRNLTINGRPATPEQERAFEHLGVRAGY